MDISLLSAILGVAAMLVLWRTIGVVASVNIHHFDGRPWRFVCLAGHWALVGAGAVAVALGSQYGGPLLLIGISLMVLADRRKMVSDRRRPG